MLRCSALPRGLVTAGVLRVQSKPAHISDRKSFVRNENIDNIYRASGSKNFGNTRMGANVLHISSLQQSLLSTSISNIGNTRMGTNVRHVSSFQQSLLSTFISKGNKTMSILAHETPCVGIVREVYSKWERRAPLCPSHVQELTNDGISVLVQPSNSRIFGDKEYEEAGAVISDNLSSATVLLGVKQVPVEKLLPGKTYMFFSHTIKGQEANMPLLDACLRNNVRLVDYECITQDGKRNGKRLIAFGSWAGRAGMINGLRGMGERLLAQGYSTPFLNMGSAYMYRSFEDARRAVLQVGEAIRSHGLPRQLAPLVMVFTSNGKASKGAQEVFELLPHQWVAPSELKDLPPNNGLVYGSVVSTEHMAKHVDGQPFNRDEYYTHGSARYESSFHTDVAPYASAIVNCTYWDARYPRLLTNKQLQGLYRSGNRKLTAVIDISCDIHGSMEFLEKTTQVEKPFYLYNPITASVEDSLEGEGVLMMAVDILPAELPREASSHFGNLLVNLVRPLLNSDATSPLQEQATLLPPALHSAIICCSGKLAPNFAYIQKMCEERERNRTRELAKEHRVTNCDAAHTKHVLLRGHLFDTGLINRALDAIEAHQAYFKLHECSVHPNHTTPGSCSISTAVIEIGCADAALMDQCFSSLQTLVSSTPKAEASMTLLSKYDDASSSGSNKDPAALSPLSQPRGRSSYDLANFHLLNHSLAAAPNRQRKLLCLGAGMVSQPLVEFLSRDSSTLVEVVSGKAGEAQALASRLQRVNVTPRTVDVLQDLAKIEELCKWADCVISLLPASMHLPIAETCIRAGTPLVTASYVSDDMQALDSRARDAGVTILCEMGLDPGMDHMSAMKMMDDAKRQGATITSFASWCGGLPSPEAANNPLRYKFSWSPRGVLSAAQNSARFLREGELVEVRGEELLASAESVDFMQAFAFEALPNRDALKYAKLYSIPDASSVYRGTLRYAGFSAIMKEIRDMGLLDPKPVELTGNLYPATWAELMQSPAINSGVTISAQTNHCLQWLGVWSDAHLERKRGWAVVDEMCTLLERKLSYTEGERDMVAMHHEILVRLPSGAHQKRTCSFVGYGKENGPTAMASTVGLTAAIGAHLILTGQLLQKGIVTPTSPQVYKPTLKMLSNEGIKFKEDVQPIHAPGRDMSGCGKTNIVRDLELFRAASAQAESSRFVQRRGNRLQQRAWPFSSPSAKLNGHQD